MKGVFIARTLQTYLKIQGGNQKQIQRTLDCFTGT